MFIAKLANGDYFEVEVGCVYSVSWIGKDERYSECHFNEAMLVKASSNGVYCCNLRFSRPGFFEYINLHPSVITKITLVEPKAKAR